MSVFTSRINGGNTYYGDYHNWTFVNPHVSGGGVGIPTTKISGKIYNFNMSMQIKIHNLKK